MSRGQDPMAARRARRERSDTLRAMLEAYIAGRGIKASSAAKYRSTVHRYLADWLDKPIADITPSMTLVRYEELCRNSIAMANLCMRAFRAVCRRAIRVLPDRADGTPLMRKVPTESLSGAWRILDRKVTLIEPDELPAWWNAVNQLKSVTSKRALQALLLTGLRKLELLHLRWIDVDENRRRLIIRDSKTGAFTKTIGPHLAQCLSEWRINDPTALVFPVDDFRSALAQIEKLGGKPISPHDLRRTFLTFGERAGTPMTILKRLANHSTRGDVTAGYLHCGEADLQHWATVIEIAILKAAGAGSSTVVELRRASWRE